MPWAQKWKDIVIPFHSLSHISISKFQKKVSYLCDKMMILCMINELTIKSVLHYWSGKILLLVFEALTFWK